MTVSFGKNGEVISSSSSTDEDPRAVEAGKQPPIASTDLSALEDLSRDLRKDPEARIAFLATFSAEEEKAVMRKVDIRFCVLIGLMFMIKGVRIIRQLVEIRELLI